MSLWLNNDESLYREAIEACAGGVFRDQAGKVTRYDTTTAGDALRLMVIEYYAREPTASRVMREECEPFGDVVWAELAEEFEELVTEG